MTDKFGQRGISVGNGGSPTDGTGNADALFMGESPVSIPSNCPVPPTFW